MSEEKGFVDVGVELDKRTKTKNDTFYVDVGKDIDIDISVSDTIIGSSLSGSPKQKKQDTKSNSKSVEKLESPKEVLIGGNGKKISGSSSTNSSVSQIPVPKCLSNVSSSSSIKIAKTVDLKDISNKLSPSHGARDRSNSFASPKELPSPERNSTGFENTEIKDECAKKSISLQKLEKPSLPLPLTPAVSPTKLYASEKGKEVSPLSSDPNYDKLKSPDDLFLVSCHDIQSKISPVVSIQGPDVQNLQDNRPPTPEYSLPSKLQNKPSSPLPKKHAYTSQSPSNKTNSELYLLSTKREIGTNIPGTHWTPLRMLQDPKLALQRKVPAASVPEQRIYQDEKPLNDSTTSDGGRVQSSKTYEPNNAPPMSQYQVQEEQSRTSLIAENPDEKEDKGEEADSDEYLLQETKDRKKSPLVAKKHKETAYAGSFEGSGIKNEEGNSSDAWLMTLSAIYGKVLLIIGLVLPLTEVISDDIPTSFFEGFFLYLYYVSILFLAFVYVSSCRKSKCGTQLVKNIRMRQKRKEKEISPEEGVAIATDESSISTYTSATIDPQLIDSNGRYLNYGSLYLRIATVAFGIGSMVYTGLECSQFFELDPDSKCYSVLQLAGPLTRLAFIFLQTYFVFMNSKLISRRYKAIFCFGLVHMIATNICIWISVVITEAKLEVDALEGYFPDTINQSGNISKDADSFESLPEPIARRRIEPMSLICHRTGIMGKFLNKYSPFLSPCVIAYSLISSGILFVIWRRTLKTTYERSSYLQVRIPESKQSLDGSHSNRGLFIGVILFVSAILSLILYFILVEQPTLRKDAVVALNCVELTLYTVTLLSVLLGIYEMKILRFRSMRTRLKLDNALLVVSQTGIMVYCIFTITASYFSSNSNHLMLFASLANLLQTCGQTLFVLNAMRRVAKNMEQVKRKPGRQVVTFLFVANYAMWALNIFEKSRAEAHPLQLDFFGIWAWSVVSQVTLPLAIFYRFHSTVCLFEVWKNCYKLKPDQL